MIFIIIKLVNYVLILVPILLNVAFITLLERKILGYSQYRLGPNKVRVIGFLQPIADAVKLFLNQIESPYNRNHLIFFVSPVISVFLVLFIWIIIPVASGFHVFIFSIILFLIILRFGVYPLLLAGWSSNRKYALIGGLRGVAQTISYEISLALILLIFLIYYLTYNMEGLTYKALRVSILVLTPFMGFFWLISCLAETNRTPFDFSEGESELVSGFNIEYGSGGFALIFIAEYARIYFLRAVSCYIITGWSPVSLISQVFAFLFVFFWVWARATLPRFRYDLLIGLAWKRILPITLGVLELLIVISVCN